MVITLNGESFDFIGGNIVDLVGQLEAVSDHVAIMVNDSIVPREEWTGTTLAEGNSVEVLTFAAGG